MRLPLLKLFLLLTFALGSPAQLLRKCLYSVPHYCACSKNDTAKIKAIRMCYDPNDHEAVCYPCPLPYQDMINCTYIEDNFPVCSLQEFSPEKFQERKPPFFINYKSTEPTFIKFTKDGYIPFRRMLVILKDPMHRDTIPSGHPNASSSDAKNYNDKLQDPKYISKINGEEIKISGYRGIMNVSDDTIFGIPKKDILKFTSASNDFGIPKKYIFLKASFNQGLGNLSEMSQLNTDTDKFVIINNKRIPMQKNYSFYPIHFDNQPFFSNIGLIVSEMLKKLLSNDMNERLEKISPKMGTNESITGHKPTIPNFGRRSIFIRRIAKNKIPEFENKAVQQNTALVKRNHKNEVIKSVESPEISLEKDVTDAVQRRGDFKAHKISFIENTEGIPENVPNVTTDLKVVQAEDHLNESNNSLSVKGDLTFLGNSENFQEVYFRTKNTSKEFLTKDEVAKKISSSFQAKDLNSTLKSEDFETHASFAPVNFGKNLNSTENVEREINSDVISLTLQDTDSTNDSKNLPPEVYVDSSSLRDSSIDGKGTSSKLSTKRIKDVDDKFPRKSSATLNAGKFKNEHYGVKSLKEFKEHDDLSRNSESFAEALPKNNSKISPFSEENGDTTGNSKDSNESNEAIINSEKNAVRGKDVIVDSETFPANGNISDSRNFEAEDTVNTQNSGNLSVFDNNIFGKSSVDFIDSEGYIRKFQENSDDKDVLGNFLFEDSDAKRNSSNSTEEDDAFSNNSKDFRIVTGVLTKEANSSTNSSDASLLSSEGMDEKHSPGKMPSGSKQRLVNKNVNIIETDEIKSDYGLGHSEGGTYKDVNESDVETLKNKTLFRLKRMPQFTNVKRGKVHFRVRINDTDEVLRSKRELSLSENKWCPISTCRRNGKLDCIIRTYGKECTLCCNKGYQIDNQKKQKFTCSRKQNKWSPNLDSAKCQRSKDEMLPFDFEAQPAAEPEAYADYYGGEYDPYADYAYYEYPYEDGQPPLDPYNYDF